MDAAPIWAGPTSNTQAGLAQRTLSSHTNQLINQSTTRSSSKSKSPKWGSSSNHLRSFLTGTTPLYLNVTDILRCGTLQFSHKHTHLNIRFGSLLRDQTGHGNSPQRGNNRWFAQVNNCTDNRHGQPTASLNPLRLCMSAAMATATQKTAADKEPLPLASD